MSPRWLRAERQNVLILRVLAGEEALVGGDHAALHLPGDFAEAAGPPHDGEEALGAVVGVHVADRHDLACRGITSRLASELM